MNFRPDRRKFLKQTLATVASPLLACSGTEGRSDLEPDAGPADGGQIPQPDSNPAPMDDGGAPADDGGTPPDDGSMGPDGSPEDGGSPDGGPDDGGAEADAPDPSAAAAVSRAYFGEAKLAGAQELGRTYLASLGRTEADIPTVAAATIALIDSQPTEAEAIAALVSEITNDFADDALVVNLVRWVLSRTELELCTLTLLPVP